MSLEATVAWILKKYIHTIEYYLALKRNEILMCVKMWRDLKNIRVRGKSQSKRTAFCMIPFT